MVQREAIRSRRELTRSLKNQYSYSRGFLQLSEHSDSDIFPLLPGYNNKHRHSRVTTITIKRLSVHCPLDPRTSMSGVKQTIGWRGDEDAIISAVRRQRF